MQHLTMADKSLLIGDEAGDLLVAYAAIVARARTGDHIALNAYGVDGQEVAAQLVLTSGTVLIAESTTSSLPEPDNEVAVQYMRDRLRYYGALPGGTPDAGWTGE